MGDAVKAFRTQIPSLGGDGGIVMESGAGKARYAAYLSASDVYDGISLTEIRVKRAPEFDGAVTVDGSPMAQGQCYCPEYLRQK
ncbi:hypothetical protein [Marinobacter sp. JSM 1782161]|uniref:hypothetical protein n=1 Tax=Marinobacter sp. JSM 1782161 TaxID=2685906 RepID=UPI0014033907|nr:hypothetical protein [Marinobacter sp. JSM 1782161]